MKLKTGDTIPALSLQNLQGKPITIPDSTTRAVHLQFRRFAGCPICSFHLRSFSLRAAEISAARVHEIVVFHSSVDTMKNYLSELPFDALADPKKELYRQFGVEASPMAKLHWKVYQYAFGGMAKGKTATHAEGGTNGLPADFLIAPDGKVIAAKYGSHAADQWSVDEMLELAKPL